ncbi:MAG: hypothetical protein AAGD34_08085 [Pseudomonadota bacterium]
MFFHGIRRSAAWAGLAAAVAFVAPVVPASAATHGAPTALTVSPTLAQPAPLASTQSAEGAVQVAQNRRQFRRRRATGRQRFRNSRRAGRVSENRNRRANRRQFHRERRGDRRMVRRERRVPYWYYDGHYGGRY